jgi:arginine exporter protein ArgO
VRAPISNADHKTECEPPAHDCVVAKSRCSLWPARAARAALDLALFSRPFSWRLLDGIVAIVMWAIAISLLA